MARPYTHLLCWDPLDPMSTRPGGVYSSRNMVAAEFERCSHIVNHGESRRLLGKQVQSLHSAAYIELGLPRSQTLRATLRKPSPPSHKAWPGSLQPSLG